LLDYIFYHFINKFIHLLDGNTTAISCLEIVNGCISFKDTLTVAEMKKKGYTLGRLYNKYRDCNRIK